MAKQGINTGTSPNDGTGDTLLVGANKINDNFDEIYSVIGVGNTLFVGIVSQITAGSNVSISTAYGSVEISASTGTAQTANISANTLVVSGVSTLTNLAEVRSDDGTPGRVDYYCEVSNNHYTRIQAAPHSEYSGNVTVILPTTDGDIIVGDTASAIPQNVNTSGIITAAEFYGDGSNLTGIVGGGSTANISADQITVSGVSTFQGNVTLGQFGGGDVNVAGDIASNLTPDGNGTRFLGANGAAWSNIYGYSADLGGGFSSGIGLTVSSDVYVGGDITGVGSVTAGTFFGDGSGLTGIVASGAGITVQDGGVSRGTASIINFDTNLSVTTVSSGIATITSSGGGGGSGFDVGYGLTETSEINIVGTGITQVDFVGVGYTVEVSGNIATVRNLSQGFEVIEITSAGFAATVFAGSQMSYNATSNNSNARWFIEDTDGLTSIGIGYETGVMGGGQLDEAGTYNIGIRAGTYFGLSERHNISLTIDPFTLTMDTAFGDETSLLMWDESSNAYGMIASGGIVDYDGANYVIDRDNSNIGSATSHAIFYSSDANRLIGFRYNASENVDSYRYWTNVTNASDGTDVGSGNILESNSANLEDQTLPENMLRATVGGGGTGGFWFPAGDRQNFLGGSHYLEITPSDSTLDNFGTNGNGSWSYGFTLEDPWIASGGIQQMLSPASAANGWHLFGINSYTIGSSDYERMMYGNATNAPTSTSSGSSYTAIDGKVGFAGSTVQVHFNDSTNAYSIHIDGTEIFSSTSPATRMLSGTTSQPVLTFGDTTLTNGGNTPGDEDEPVPWYTRIRDLWIDNSGVLGPSSFTAIGTFRDRNLETYDGYQYIDVYTTLTGAGTSVKKGGVSLARGTVTFT